MAEIDSWDEEWVAAMKRKARVEKLDRLFKEEGLTDEMIDKMIEDKIARYILLKQWTKAIDTTIQNLSGPPGPANKSPMSQGFI